jgi:hypothetical protein
MARQEIYYGIWYNYVTVWDNTKFETLILIKTDTVLIGDYHINL